MNVPARRQRRSRLAAAALAAGLLAAAWTGGCAREAETRPEPVHLKVAAMPFLSSAPIEIARQRGFFRDEGIDVEMVNLGSTEAVTALASEQVDVYANFVAVGLINAIARGAKIAIVADKGYAGSRCAADGLLIRNGLERERKLDTPEGLRGLKVGVRPMSTAEYMIDRLLEKHGLTREAITIVDVPTEAVADSLASGAIDLRAHSEPAVTRLADLGIAHMWLPFSAIEADAQWAVIAFGPRLLERERPLGVRFLRAYLRGVRAYGEGTTASNVAALAAMTGEPEELIRRACWPTVRPDGRVNAQSVAAFAAWAREHGYSESPVPRERLIDTAILDEARRP